MIVSIARTVAFRPQWGGNQDLPSVDQISVAIRVPTTEERRRHVRSDVSVEQDERSPGGFRPRVDMRLDVPGLLRRYITRIDNLTARDEAGTEIPIRTAEELLATPGLAELEQEIGSYIASIAAQPGSLDPTSAAPSFSGVEPPLSLAAAAVGSTPP